MPPAKRDRMEDRAEREYPLSKWIPEGVKYMKHLKDNPLKLGVYERYLKNTHLPALEAAYKKQKDEAKKASESREATQHEASAISKPKRSNNTRFERGGAPSQVCCFDVLENSNLES